MIKHEKSTLKQILPHVAAILLFLIITLIYFSPIIQGKMLPQGDTKQYTGSSQELRDYYNNEGESSAWTGAMFSGMPAYQIGIWGGSPNILDYVEKPLKALGNTTAGPVFAAMLMAYILFVVMGFTPSIAVLGAIAYSLSSYNIIILDAGHVTKAWAIAYMPLIVAGIMALFRQKTILGGLLMALGLALQIKNNHLQITYYTAMLCAILYIGLVVDLCKKKNFKFLFQSTGILILAIVFAGLCNAGNLYANYEMGKESTRGQSELTPKPVIKEEGKEIHAKQSSGLPWEYVFDWSYGKAETLSLLVPNAKGGASGGMLDRSSHLGQELVKQGYGDKMTDKGIQAQTYWGNQPFTSGPVYIGSIICFLFILGMIVIRNPLKWALLFATIFFLFLAWGKNWEWFNDFFFYHLPYYNKFRSVSTALVIPALTMLMLAVWGIKDFLAEEMDNKSRTKALYISTSIAGGLCLLLWIAPSFFFNFVGEGDKEWTAQMPEWYYTALLLDRKDLVSTDALRSLFFILCAGGLLWTTLRVKMDSNKLLTFTPLAIALLVLIDMWGIDKRYLNEDNFISKSEFQQQLFQESPADKVILQDKTASYRVLNLNQPFTEATTSYYHKSIGGYHAAKLKRYQSLIDYRLIPEISTISQSFQSNNIDSITQSFAKISSLNMLNAKYIIYNPNENPLINPYALGNAWFVSNYRFAKNADEEIAALGTLNPSKDAIIDKKFEQEITGLNIMPDSLAYIMLTTYKPNKLVYKTKANSEQLAIFSEIYYANGWKAYIDGKESPHLRANWTLRAMRVPAGEHEITFIFNPQDYTTTRAVATASSSLLVCLLVTMLGLTLYKKKREGKTK